MYSVSRFDVKDFIRLLKIFFFTLKTINHTLSPSPQIQGHGFHIFVEASLLIMPIHRGISKTKNKKGHRVMKIDKFNIKFIFKF